MAEESSDGRMAEESSVGRGRMAVEYSVGWGRIRQGRGIQGRIWWDGVGWQ